MMSLPAGTKIWLALGRTDMRRGMDGLALMKRVLQLDRAVPVILITAHGDVHLAVEAMRAGALGK